MIKQGEIFFKTKQETKKKYAKLYRLKSIVGWRITAKKLYLKVRRYQRESFWTLYMAREIIVKEGNFVTAYVNTNHK